MESVTKINPAVGENLSYLKTVFGSSSELIETAFTIPGINPQAGLAYLESISDREMIRRDIMAPLLQFGGTGFRDPNEALAVIRSRVIPAGKIKTSADLSEIVGHILNGDTALFLNGADSALIIGSRKIEKRAISGPENEATVFGSQESFTDDLETNTGLIRKRLPVPALRLEEFTAGTLTRTKLKLVWLEGMANPEIIREAQNRIRKIDIDRVDGIGTIGELIEDKPLSIFPKYRQTERPDIAVKEITDGCFAVICGNSPFALTAPCTFWDNFKNMDDYQERSLISSFLRIVRYISFFLCTALSSLYLSFVTYNQAIVPPTLALSIAVGREGSPLPSVLELLLLTLAITIIREAGLRMHGSVGYFVGALAAVVIGQAVVTAGYVSPSVIIVVAVATISSFAITSTTLLYPARLINYFFILCAGAFGIFGVINGVILVFWHLCSLGSFGVPYLYPVIPYDREGFKDVFIRPGYRALGKRSKILSPHNTVRAGNKGKK